MRLSVPATEDETGEDHDEDKTGHLDDRHHDVGAQRLADAARVQQRHGDQEHEGRRGRRDVPERLQVVPGEGERNPAALVTPAASMQKPTRKDTGDER